MKNKLKLSLITIATLVASNTNAQTFYSCIPEGCPAGQYFDGKKCLSIENLISSQLCPEGYIVDSMKCCKKTRTYEMQYGLSQYKKPTPVSKNGVTAILKSDCKIFSGKCYEITLEKGDCVTYYEAYSNAPSGYFTTCWSCEEIRN
ncbi:hypothetical protein HDR59_02810 [bacterium]|nr:hypothetical protein [bacterium]